jgi:hypothetical protein
LIRVVHPVEAVKCLVASFATNLARNTVGRVDRRPTSKCLWIL